MSKAKALKKIEELIIKWNISPHQIEVLIDDMFSDEEQDPELR